MRSLDPGQLPAGHEALQALWTRLQTEIKPKASAKKAKRDARQAGNEAAAPAMDTDGESLDMQQSLDLVVRTLSSSPSDPITASSRLAASTVALEVLGFLFITAHGNSSSPTPKPPSHLHIFTTATLTQLTAVIYSAWDVGQAGLVLKAKFSLDELLKLSKVMSSTLVAQSLLEEIVVAPWLSKRSIGIFGVLLDYMTVQEISIAFGQDVMVKFTTALEEDEVAVISGRVAMRWITNVCEAGVEEESFWIDPVAATLRNSAKGRINIGLYLLPELFLAQKKAFRTLLGKFENALEEADLEGAITTLIAGNRMGLVELDVEEVAKKPKKDAEPKMPLPENLLNVCLYHSSPSLRCSALSLLVTTTQTTLRFSPTALTLLKSFFTYSLGEEDGEVRMNTINYSGKLLLRLRDSSWKQIRLGNNVYIEHVKEFLNWWATELVGNLNPAKPYRLRINSLRLLDMLLQSQLDSNFAPTSFVATGGYSSYRKTAITPAPKFQGKRKATQLPTASGATTPSAWPFEIELVTSRMTSTLLTLFLSTYTALRALSLTILERFPSPLPGYEGVEGEARAQKELLLPALSMVRSGRESDASAGAGVVGLLWRKWVLEGGAKWDLGVIGGWRTTAKASEGSLALSFIKDLMDLADIQIAAHLSDLGRAASTSPMHGTLLALRHLFTSVPVASFAELATTSERRETFLRALGVVEQVWSVTRVVLAASAPEGSVGGTTDTEEARALTLVGDDVEMETAAEEGSGSGGPMHKVILSATWRAMKEAGELLETILRLPSELGAEEFQAIWRLDEVQHMGDLYAIWLTQIRHRGALMAIHPCYSRACAALLVCKDWPEVERLPVQWLNSHLESIVSKKISITRRSAGVPFCILGCLSAIIPTNPVSFDPAFSRLLEIAESKTTDILDESRVHAMNTLRTILLDAKATALVAPYLERAFLLAISMFWSPNWICRNVAMILYGSLVTRAFGNRRINLDRDHLSLAKRLTVNDFFARYPSLHAVLLAELEFSSREHLNDLPTSDLHSSLFSVLMMLSLMQTPNQIAGAAQSLSDPFIPLVRACAKSRVWKIRDKAGDALTALIPALEIATTCLDILDDIESCQENELYGRLVQVLRLFEMSGPPTADNSTRLDTRLTALSTPLLSPRHSFSTRTTYVSILRVFAILTSLRPPALNDKIHAELDLTRSWSISTAHLPSAENFVTALYLLALLYDPTNPILLSAGINSNFLSIQRETMAHLASIAGTTDGIAVLESVSESLLAIALKEDEAGECRIAAIELLAGTSLLRTCEGVSGMRGLIGVLLERYRGSMIVPLKEALLPLIARFIALANETAQLSTIFQIITFTSDVNQSIESRESSAQALRQLVPLFPVSDSPPSNLAIASSPPLPSPELTQFARLILRLTQDDDSTVREYAAEVLAERWTDRVGVVDRKAIELALLEVGCETLEETMEEFKIDLATLSNPSSLLFTVEKPNIYHDDLLEAESLLAIPSLQPPSFPLDSLSTLRYFLSSLEPLLSGLKEEGPLGIGGSALVAKWCYRLLARIELLRLSDGEKVKELEVEFPRLLTDLAETVLLRRA